jgi:hypothetical protein
MLFDITLGVAAFVRKLHHGYFSSLRHFNEMPLRFRAIPSYCNLFQLIYALSPHPCQARSSYVNQCQASLPRGLGGAAAPPYQFQAAAKGLTRPTFRQAGAFGAHACGTSPCGNQGSTEGRVPFSPHRLAD